MKIDFSNYVFNFSDDEVEIYGVKICIRNVNGFYVVCVDYCCLKNILYKSKVV